MSFNTAPGRAEYTASAAQTDFTFPFKIFNTSDVKVYLTPVGQTADDTADILIETTDYTVSINGDNGGDMTLTSGATLNDSVTLVRSLPIARDTEYQHAGDLTAEALNSDQEYQTYLILDASVDFERSLKIPSSVQSFNTELPSPIANKLLVLNNNADGFDLLSTSSTGFFNDAFIVDTIAAMLGVDPNLYGSVIARGYNSANDGGGGLFNYDATQSAVNNGGTIIDGWVRQHGTELDSKWFGADSVNMYCSPSGTGHGFNTSNKCSLAYALNLMNDSGTIKGKWTINLEAGTYTPPNVILDNISNKDYLYITGEVDGGGIPTSIIDVNSGVYGFWAIGNIWLWFKDIKIINATGSTVAAGIILDKGVVCVADNVHTYNTQWAGINYNIDCRAIVYGGLYENSNGYGIKCYGGTVFSIGTSSQRPKMKDCGIAGFGAQGNTYGHADFCDFESCVIGILSSYNSHLAAISNTYTNCTTNLQTEGHSSIRSELMTTTGELRNSRSKSSLLIDSDNGSVSQYETQFYADSGAYGRSSFGYATWTPPTVKFQYSNDGTTTGYALSPFVGCTALWESNANTILAIAAPDTHYSAIWFGDSVSAERGEIKQTGGKFFFGLSNVSKFVMGDTYFYPYTDNTLDLGRATFRWGTVYAGTGTINTSDEREKTTLLDIDETEKLVAVELKKALKKFKFLDAVEEKGDDARIHFGVGTQTVAKIFSNYNLDATKYALFCYDEWNDEFQEHPEILEQKDDDGNIIIEYEKAWTEQTLKAGDRYGIRYSELLAFIISAI